MQLSKISYKGRKKQLIFIADVIEVISMFMLEY